MESPTKYDIYVKRLELELSSAKHLIQEAKTKATGANIHDINQSSAYLEDATYFLKNRTERLRSMPLHELVAYAEHVISHKCRLRLLMAGVSPTEAYRRRVEGRPEYTLKEIEEMLQ